MNGLSKKLFDILEIYLPVVIFFLLILTVFIQVVSRYGLNRPLPKFFELSIYSFVWAIYLGAALAKRYDQHIRFDIFYRQFSPKVRAGVDIVFDLLTTGVMLLLLYPSIEYTIWNYKIKASALRIPWTYLLLCFPIFIVLIILHNGLAVYHNIALLRGRERPREEVLPWQ
ncbi:TRAP transporter small permease subunit [candidate division KSB3 bacterium]|uniref:TRAP transporter small permease subunit n=1 Tax=candidate division KSB3 bacterium TaxID=2044937 RepID=A0A9D5JTN6_9BACT|nr:TRAP transporter small permease subunit [candidate division KSB3 bacterium]MBD3324017.1 TRAP transporter small permease subunit [candidate division KSB3 bacterium]